MGVESFLDEPAAGGSMFTQNIDMSGYTWCHVPENRNYDIHDYDKPTFSIVLSNFIYRKLRTVLTNRVLRFLHEKSTKATAEFEKFYKDYGMFLKEGIVTANEQLEKASHFHPHVVLYLLVFFMLKEIFFIYLFIIVSMPHYISITTCILNH